MNARKAVKANTKFIVVTGGVCSSLGKGIAAASIGAILKACGKKIFVQKLDPYLNVDPGTMSPFQHGEVFVTDDGAETDLDLGHYERFIDISLTKESSVTTGQVYKRVIDRERKGDYKGGTVQVVPHITDEIKDRILHAAETSKADVILLEIGGTVGDIEGQPYLEAIRQLKSELDPSQIYHVHLTLLPYLEASNELKTKPSQHSVMELRRNGLQPDMILARADKKISKSLLDKLSAFCGVKREAVIPALTLPSIYDVPLALQQYNVGQIIGDSLGFGKLKPNMKEWEAGNKRHIHAAKKDLTIALVGKYTNLEDAYLSVIEAVKSASVFADHKAHIIWIDSEKLEEKDKAEWEKLKGAQGIVVPGGFGIRGIEGKIAAANYARTNNIPYLGLCLGSQILTIEFARAALKDTRLTSQEFDEKGKLDPSKYVIHFLPDQHKDKDIGGTLRLGAYECTLQKGTIARKAYGTESISERHRHRYEFNNSYKKRLEEGGLVFSGIWRKSNLMEIVEIKDHPFMVGTQFHPEFKSRPHKPHPLFKKFIETAVKNTAS
jgi:CTP synthase